MKSTLVRFVSYDDAFGFCWANPPFAVKYGQTVIIAAGLAIGLLLVVLARIWTSDRKYVA